MFNKTSNVKSIKKALSQLFYPYFELFSESDIESVINSIIRNKIFEPYALGHYLQEELIKKVGITNWSEIEERLEIGF